MTTTYNNTDNSIVSKKYKLFFQSILQFFIKAVISAIIIGIIMAGLYNFGLEEKNFVAIPLYIVVVLLYLYNAYLFILILVSFCKFFYSCWATIQDDGYAMTTPEKAVGFLFIPLFNFYWIFIAYYGLATQVNEYIERHNLDDRKKIKKGQTLTFCILTVLVLPIPFVGWFLISIVSIILFFMTINDFKSCCSYIEESKPEKIRPLNY